MLHLFLVDLIWHSFGNELWLTPGQQDEIRAASLKSQLPVATAICARLQNRTLILPSMDGLLAILLTGVIAALQAAFASGDIFLSSASWPSEGVPNSLFLVNNTTFVELVNQIHAFAKIKLRMLVGVLRGWHCLHLGAQIRQTTFCIANPILHCLKLNRMSRVHSWCWCWKGAATWSHFQNSCLWQLSSNQVGKGKMFCWAAKDWSKEPPWAKQVWDGGYCPYKVATDE